MWKSKKKLKIVSEIFRSFINVIIVQDSEDESGVLTEEDDSIKKMPPLPPEENKPADVAQNAVKQRSFLFKIVFFFHKI